MGSVIVQWCIHMYIAMALRQVLPTVARQSIHAPPGVIIIVIQPVYYALMVCLS